MGSGLGSQGFRQGTGLETHRVGLSVGVEISRKSGSQAFDRLRTLDFPFAGREWEVEILTKNGSLLGGFGPFALTRPARSTYPSPSLDD